MITDKFRFVKGKESENGAPGEIGRELAERKASLRAYMKRRRGENENRDAKEELLAANFFSEQAAEKESFFVYLSFSSEAPTDKLIRTLLAKGKQVFCPRVEGNGMVAVAYGEDFTLSPCGIVEPVGEAYAGKIDVAVIPLLAVDLRGARLGYGRGYYDRFLRDRPEMLRAAYCFDFQIVREVPEEPSDERVDLIVTDRRTVKTEGRKGADGRRV